MSERAIGFEGAYNTAIGEISRLRAEIERLRLDKLRLDWLEKTCSGASDSGRYLPFRIYRGGGSHGDIRRAIDEAMEDH
jgi:hypothetical protein